jgi:L-arabinonolactonase
MEIRRLDVPDCVIGESPIWDINEQVLYFVDVFGKKIHRHEPQSGVNHHWDVPDLIGSMALRASGGAIIALRDGLYTMDFETGTTAPLVKPDEFDPRLQFNDGKVDRRGRFLVCTLDSRMEESLGSLYSLGDDQHLRVIDRNIFLGNGPCWSPDNKTFYFSDSARNTIYAYDYDIASGVAGNRRNWVNTEELGGIPDGATVDADGLLWVSIDRGGKIAAYRPDGKLERTIDLAISMPASLTFGGPNLDRLYVTSIDTRAAGLDPEPGGGSTYVIEGLGARGLPEPRYAR